MSHLTTLFDVLSKDGVIIFLHECIALCGGHEAVGIEVVHLRSACALESIARECQLRRGVLSCITLGSGKLEQTVVGLGSHHVVLDFNHLALSCTHESGSVVTIAELFALSACFVFNPFLTNETFSIHSNEGCKAVATVNVETLGHRTESVSSIKVTTVLHVVLHAPMEVVVVIVVGVFPIRIPEPFKTMDVCAFCTNHFTEQTSLLHGESCHFVLIIAAVFEDETVEASFFRKVNQAPALFEVHGRRHFDSSVLSILHCELGHGIVVVPVGGDVNQIDVVALADFFITFLTIINIRRFQTYLAQFGLASLCTLLLVIAESYDFHTGDVAETNDGPRTTHAETNECHTHCFDGSGSQTEHVLLTGRALGSVNHDGTLVPMPFGAGRK